MNTLNAAQRMQNIERFEKLTIKEYGTLVYENEQLLQRVGKLEQQLTDVRRAERERIAQYVQQGTGDWMLGKKIAAAIRAME